MTARVAPRPSDELLDRVAALLGARPISWRQAVGGYSMAQRWSFRLADGRRVFAKLAGSDVIAAFLRLEHANMSAIDADFRCEVIAFQDGERPLMLLEDLSEARWPPPWEPGDVERLLATLERVWTTPPPEHLPSAETKLATFSGWQQVEREPERFLTLGIGSRDWLAESLIPLVDAERAATLGGSELIHLDVRSDNVCFAGDRVVLVDWNWACRGDRRFDLAEWLPSLRLEGGPLPEEVAPGLGNYAAIFSGYFAANASLPPPPDAPTVRTFQLRQLRIALPWACRELGLPQPDVPYARNDIAGLDEDLAAGWISEAEWHERIEHVLIDAYLASDDPRAQSGKSGDETDWRWSRELVLDVFLVGARQSFLDIGCANGYLMESLVRWGAERGIEVEPYGLDISARMVSLARRRLPHWTDRIFVGNAIEWTPSQRFDVVQAGLDEVPPRRRRELVDLILREYLVPGGRLVLRAGRVEPGSDYTLDQLGAVGLQPDGVIEARHPGTGELRRTAYLTAPVG